MRSAAQPALANLPELPHPTASGSSQQGQLAADAGVGPATRKRHAIFQIQYDEWKSSKKRLDIYIADVLDDRGEYAMTVAGANMRVFDKDGHRIDANVPQERWPVTIHYNVVENPLRTPLNC